MNKRRKKKNGKSFVTRMPMLIKTRCLYSNSLFFFVDSTSLFHTNRVNVVGSRLGILQMKCKLKREKEYKKRRKSQHFCDDWWAQTVFIASSIKPIMNAIFWCDNPCITLDFFFAQRCCLVMVAAAKCNWTFWGWRTNSSSSFFLLLPCLGSMIANESNVIWSQTS